tara:strand:+ start:305 stop:727 length:423 start_codon:yes stop_codon:yes gene_type:complete
MQPLRASVSEGLHRRFSVGQGVLALIAGFTLILVHTRFDWFWHPMPIVGAILLAILVASVHRENWRRVLGSSLFTATGGAIGMIDPRCMPMTPIFLAVLGWLAFGLLAKLNDRRLFSNCGPTLDNASRPKEIHADSVSNG